MPNQRPVRKRDIRRPRRRRSPHRHHPFAPAPHRGDPDPGARPASKRSDPDAWPSRAAKDRAAARTSPHALPPDEDVIVERRAVCEPPRRSRRVVDVALRFGLSLDPASVTLVGRTNLPCAQGRLTAIVGASGSGKSSVLACLLGRFPQAVCVDRVVFPEDSAVVDTVAPTVELREALRLLGACGLAEAPLWLRRFSVLSEGEKFRTRLAAALGLALERGRSAPLLCDEFCSGLHRRAALAVAHNLRKIARREKLSIVVACSQEDVLADLAPDVVVRMRGGGRCEIETGASAGGALSLRRRMVIAPGCKRDYEAFAPLHYRATDELGFVDKVFTMREGAAGEILGIVVYSHGPLELALRNRATAGRFVRKPAELNRCVRMLRRLVIHPDLRGCGLGQWLVRRTLPRVGTEYVECLAAMGDVNPVFERAGMARIGQCELSPRRRAALERLSELGVDPHSHDLLEMAGRDRRVRKLVAQVVREWYQATTGGGDVRVERQPPELLARTFRGLVGHQPVYYLWHRRGV